MMGNDRLLYWYKLSGYEVSQGLTFAITKGQNKLLRVTLKMRFRWYEHSRTPKKFVKSRNIPVKVYTSKVDRGLTHSFNCQILKPQLAYSEVF